MSSGKAATDEGERMMDAKEAYVVLLEQPGGTVVRLTAGPDDVFDHLGGVLLEQHEVPELGLERTTWKRQPKSQDPIREEAVVAQLDPVRTECAQPPLDLRESSVVVLLKNVQGV